MAIRTCLGCGGELIGEVVTLEHLLPDWLAKEIELPGVSLRHFLHDEGKPEDTLLRSQKPALNCWMIRQFFHPKHPELFYDLTLRRIPMLV